MKKLLLIIFFPIAFTYGQNVGIGTFSPDPNAILDIKSGNKGILIPRMDSTARKLITPIKGLLVFDTSSNSFWFSNGTIWKDLSATSGWSLSGNANTSPVTNFLGTLDDKPLTLKINNQQAALLNRNLKNSFFGYQSGLYDSVATENTGIGYQSLYTDSSGNSNTAVGAFSLFSNLSGNANTATGNKSLYTNTTGIGNTANGLQSLYSNVAGNNNASFGFQSLYSNNAGSFNTANGAQALFSNTSGSYNTASGSLSLYANASGIFNTGNGFQSLFSDSTGNFNTSAGAQALFSLKTGNNNTGNGVQALYSDSSGNANTSAGYQSSYFNKTGNNNAAIGNQALFTNITGDQNTAIGSNALMNVTGLNNIGLGYNSGVNLTNGNNNIAIGNAGVSGESNSIRIGNLTTSKTFVAGVFGSLTAASGIPVFVDANGQFGTVSSSARYKQDINDMGKISEDIYKLRPVTFKYRQLVSKGDHSLQYGLIAEEVEKINPLLVAHNIDGSIFTVKYQLLTPLMLNEIIKQRTIIEKQQLLFNKQSNQIEQLLLKTHKIEQLEKEINELRKLVKKN